MEETKMKKQKTIMDEPKEFRYQLANSIGISNKAFDMYFNNYGGIASLEKEETNADSKEKKKDTNTFYVYGMIVSDELKGYLTHWFGAKNLIAPGDVRDFVDGVDKNKEITLRFNSPGGVIYAAAAMCSLLDKYDYNCVVDGMCASAATWLLFGGNKRVGHNFSTVLVHRVTGSCQGNYKDFEIYSKMIHGFDESIIDMYEKHTNMKRDEIVALMDEDRMMAAKEANKKGFFTEMKKEKKNSSKDNESDVLSGNDSNDERERAIAMANVLTMQSKLRKMHSNKSNNLPEGA